MTQFDLEWNERNKAINREEAVRLISKVVYNLAMANFSAYLENEIIDEVGQFAKLWDIPFCADVLTTLASRTLDTEKHDDWATSQNC